MALVLRSTALGHHGENENAEASIRYLCHILCSTVNTFKGSEICKFAIYGFISMTLEHHSRT